jgi:hypothetical protein
VPIGYEPPVYVEKWYKLKSDDTARAAMVRVWLNHSPSSVNVDQADYDDSQE